MRRFRSYQRLSLSINIFFFSNKPIWNSMAFVSVFFLSLRSKRLTPQESTKKSNDTLEKKNVWLLFKIHMELFFFIFVLKNTRSPVFWLFKMIIHSIILFFFEKSFCSWVHSADHGRTRLSFFFFLDLTVCYKCESERIITFEEETQWRYFCCAWIVWLVYMVLRLWFSRKLWVTAA